MTSEQVIRWLPFAFPLLFVAMWLFVSTLLGLMTGWFNLQQWYPDDGSEEPLLTLRGQSGSMGWGLSLNNCLRLRAYRSGLGIGIWRIFAPFQKPLLIPWREVKVEETKTFFVPMVRLDFGDPSNGSLKISVRNWSKLADAISQAGVDVAPKFPAISATAGDVARGMSVGWLAMSAFAAAFFYIASRTGGGAGLPLILCIGISALIFGLATLIQYARQS